jgi:hypothetical protein
MCGVGISSDPVIMTVPSNATHYLVKIPAAGKRKAKAAPKKAAPKKARNKVTAAPKKRTTAQRSAAAKKAAVTRRKNKKAPAFIGPMPKGK